MSNDVAPASTTAARNGLTIDRAVMAMAGTLVLVSVLLATTVSIWWLALATFVGANLLQSSITGFCPAALILAKLGVPAGCAFR